MSVALSRYPTFIFLALALLCSSLPAHAGPFLATLDDFHPIATFDSSIYPPTNTPPCAACVPTSNKSTIKPTAKPYAPTATAVKPSSKSSPATHSTQTPPAIMLKTATSPAWTMRWMKWKSNTASIICSIRANASNGCLHACADG